ncbi:type IX secretion system sortase PorU [Neolewinella aurantiaca]|uniref:Type IX secretion system sortase PorU n=1 Tax=Neolewinella aurantiaca TaxID=2602767 RepID=A0A5C7F5D1_9BACT|nr:type IX secretion system sortase PorU [Neolewinella aurantiaca]TXF84244.1 type IX secretion system sortase PorU [Neolewinella aurantiaca]
MHKLLFTLLLAIFSLFLSAQVQLSDQLLWDEAPTVVEWNGATQVQFAYTFADNGAGAGASKVSDQPLYLRTFPAQPGRTYTVEVINSVFEPVSVPRGAADFPEEFDFSVSVSRQPEGYLGKVAAPAMIKTPTGVQRLLSLEIRLVPAAAPNARPRTVFATNSVLREGDWYRFTVAETGVHKLTRAFLTDELGVNLDGVDPRNIAVFGQPFSGKLPETINVDAPDDLTEMPIIIRGEGDGSFDGEDFIVFHAQGPDRIEYEPNGDYFDYEKNVYATTNSYFLRVGGTQGRRVSALPAASGGTEVSSYDAVYHFEEDKFNILHQLGGNSHGSGQSWWGDLLAGAREVEYRNVFRIPGLVSDQDARIRARMALRTDATSRFLVEVGDQVITSSIASSVRIGQQEQSAAAIPTLLDGAVKLPGEDVTITLNYPRPANSSTSEGYLDWFQVRARRQLSFNDLDQFDFRDVGSMNQPTVRFQFSGSLPSDATVWRIDGADVRSADVSGGAFSAAANGQLFEYVAFRSEAELLTPQAAGMVANQNLHAEDNAEMIIIAHPRFLQQAELLAEHRRSHNGLETVLVTTQQIYNEFSSGRDDASALRNFTLMLYERSPNLRYLLLFGDGSFDHRNILELGTNFIPAFEHDGKLTEVGSFPADDFFGIFTNATNNQPLEPDLNVAVGRLPVKTADEATQVVQKLIRYDTEPNTLGDWRTRMVFVGDDEDSNQHARDVDQVATSVAELKPDLNFDKLYFDLFPQQSLSAGDRYPDITEGLDRAIFRGALAVTYLGHGGPRGWAQERVLTIPQIRNWNRPSTSEDPIQPPVFITATCTFSNYDDAAFVSAGEEALLTPNGGVAALLTTTRPVFATRNFILTDETVKAMLERPDGNWRTVGDIIRIAKNNVTAPTSAINLNGNTENARKFTLLGDPAMVIAFPEHSVRTTMINDQPITEERQDTVRALQQMKISGEITDIAGNLLSDFNGQVFPTIYDKARTVSTLQQDQPTVSPLEVSVQRNIVFRGRATVTNGKFEFEFVVPRDIDYAFGAGKVSYYAADLDQFTDASGFYDQLIIGGSSTDVITDDEGPVVEVFMDDENFISGGETGQDPILLVNLTDDLGINVTGNSIGHDLEAVLDEDTRNSIVLNDYYEAEADDFRKGTVRYPLFDLEPGLHTITVRAWDVANNSAQGTTEFFVAADGADAISRVLNYPNPFTDRTCFQFDHTLVGQEVEAIVQIYTVNGRLVKTLTRAFPFADGTVRQDDCIEWDGLDDYGDQLARGVYLYQVRLRGDSGTIVDGELEKLVILK